MVDGDWQRDVLRFWFEEIDRKCWFEPAADTDETIRRRFEPLHRRLREAVPAAAFREADAALAAVLVYDQFPRNMFRGTAEAFATDPLALAVAGNALARRFDAGLDESARVFLYMPFMHSEDLADQIRCVALFETLPGDNVKYAVEHREIIERFGRFPHRNRALGRVTTEEEAAFLTDHKGFGQSAP
ncbi:MAG: DUF924 family protein [Mesorhizobium sp.]|jgi:uncharacterized protein (DUF924 family)